MNDGECFYTVQSRYVKDGEWNTVLITKTSQEALAELRKRSIYVEHRILQTSVVWPPTREPFLFNICRPRDAFAFFLIEKQAFTPERVAKCKQEWDTKDGKEKKRFEALADDDLNRYWREYAEEFHSATS